MILQGKTEFGKGRCDHVRPGPAEPAVPSYASGRDPPEGIILALCFQHSLARKGLAVFNRYAHSAGPKIIKNRPEAQILIQNSIFDDFENFGFLSKIWFLGILGGHWRLGDSGNVGFFGF